MADQHRSPLTTLLLLAAGPALALLIFVAMLWGSGLLGGESDPEPAAPREPEDPARMWAPDAPIAPAMEKLIQEAIYAKQPFALEYGKLKALHSELQRIEWDEDDDEGGDYKKYAKAKARREAVEQDLPQAKAECVRGMIAQAAGRTRDPRLTQAAEWIAKFRVVEQAFFEAQARYDQAMEAKRRGEGTKREHDAAFQAWSTTGREWGEWKKERDGMLDPAKRALMEIRAQREEGK